MPARLRHLRAETRPGAGEQRLWWYRAGGAQVVVWVVMSAVGRRRCVDRNVLIVVIGDNVGRYLGALLQHVLQPCVAGMWNRLFCSARSPQVWCARVSPMTVSRWLIGSEKRSIPGNEEAPEETRV